MRAGVWPAVATLRLVRSAAGQLQLSALCVVLQTGERRIEQPVQQLRVWSCALLHELLHAVGIDQQAAQAKRIGGG